MASAIMGPSLHSTATVTFASTTLENTSVSWIDYDRSVFWVYIYGIISIEYVEKKNTINSEYNNGILDHLEVAIHQGNVQSHKSIKSKKYS